MEKEAKNRATKNMAVIVAGGKGLRMGASLKKQYLSLDGIPVLVRTLMAFDIHPRVDEIILVVPQTDIAYCRETLIKPNTLTRPVHLVPGGLSRQDSVACGLVMAHSLSTDTKSSFVLVHDGVRPFVDPAITDRCLDKAKKKGGCIPVLGISDTVKEVRGDCQIVKTLDRGRLFNAQTPQVFRLDLILSAFAHAGKTDFSGTDEASVLEHAGIPVYTVSGDPFNIKLTTPRDLVLAQFLIEKKAVPCSRLEPHP